MKCSDPAVCRLRSLLSSIRTEEEAAAAAPKNDDDSGANFVRSLAAFNVTVDGSLVGPSPVHITSWSSIAEDNTVDRPTDRPNDGVFFVFVPFVQKDSELSE